MDLDYMNLAVRTTELQVRRHEVNSKAYNALIACLARHEFDRVSDLLTAREIWARLANFHEGTNHVKSRLYETHRREYENFTQLPGESIDTMFSRCNEYGTIYAISSDFGDRMTTQHLD